MNKFELVFIPVPGHLPSTIALANILVTRDERLSVTMLIHRLPSDTNTPQHIQSLFAPFTGKSIHFIILPELPPPQQTKRTYVLHMIDTAERYKPSVREAVTKLSHSSKLVGFVLDLFCITMIDVAKEFQLPCYMFNTSSVGNLAFVLELQQLSHKHNGNVAVEQLLNSEDELVVSGFVNPIPTKVFRSSMLDCETAVEFHGIVKRVRSEIKGILVNTFAEMESRILNSMSSMQVPPLYPVGPILHLKHANVVESDRSPERADVLKWLDDQPPSSVIFLCFGRMGSFDKDQVGEIAHALEKSGAHFVWSLRQPSSKTKFEAPKDYVDISNILPEGFLDRTTSIGKVIGWAPQAEILAHPATGGFISHCGWNSTMESLWYGVPMITWPMYAEQQFNAFEMVVELGLAVDIVLDYRMENPRIVSAKEIESGIRKLMEDDGKIRKKVQAKSEESRKSVMKGGSSFISAGKFIDDVLNNSSGGGN